uniref:Receptor-like serine/threonine-protein kinase n=1 Tax=Anthurium amnicola TaxID=1678845 RepID=A0A1D1XWH9_9ARAE
MPYTVKASFLSMGTNHRTCSSFPIFLLCLTFLTWDAHLCTAADIIYPAQSLTGKQTIVSKEGNFELGFFSPGNSRNYYTGIWYKKIAKQTVVWVANRDNPVQSISSSELKISEDGNLVLVDHSRELVVWSSNATSKSNSTVAVLLDSGNLVLRDPLNSSAITWQSFNHPTDTWLPGGRLGMNKITGEYQILTSWKNSEDPSRGLYSESLDPRGFNQHVFMWNRSKIYWQSGDWNGEIFTLVPGMQERVLFNLSFVETKEVKYSTYTIGSKSLITRSVVDQSGQVKQWVWVDSTQEWLLIWAQPIAQCDAYFLCGPNGVCNHKNMPCECLQGFEPASTKEWQLSDWSGGCRRKTNLHCSSNGSAQDANDGFLMSPNMRLPEDSHQLKVESIRECELACQNNCSCTAFSYGNGCSIWRGDLWNLQQLADGDSNQTTLHLRVAASDLPVPSRKNKRVPKIVIFSVVSAVILLGIVLMLLWRFPRRSLTGLPEAVEGSLVQFTYADLQRATKNFSEKIGRGGFGIVFKGAFPDSVVVAVKKLELEGLRQGEKQFRNEVSTLGTIQHVNLVRLRGFCSEGSKRLLVYDYMPNGSLDHHLFRNNQSMLDWRRRYSIVLGVARALAYLHEKCRHRIIHCDIKPENILLDGDFNPKVADLGLAKLVGRDFSKVLTTVRGTIGYLAPEWISGLPITPKADAYSFGMMLFEVISGRRNSDHSAGGAVGYFPIWAAKKLQEGEIYALLDERLQGGADMEEVSRASKVACWCIQDNESHRPSMGQVVQILEGVLMVDVPPIPVSLGCLIEDQNVVSPSMSLLQVDTSHELN